MSDEKQPASTVSSQAETFPVASGCCGWAKWSFSPV